MGDDIMSKKDNENHFKWCWNQVITSFKREHIYFNNQEEIYTYFNTLFVECFYDEDDKSDDNINDLLIFWSTVFNYTPSKTRSELETLFDLYKLFDKSIHI